jgi:hypothetical protein
LEHKLEHRISEARLGQRNLYFCDAAHFVGSSFLGYLWSIAKVFIPALSGRKRYNVCGMLNPITFDFIYTCNETYITCIQICFLLRLLKLKHPTNIPITVVLDNAKYQNCKLVSSWALELGIELLYLPSYSPNLNIIERYWKWLRKSYLNNRSFNNFNELKTAIDDALKTTIKGEIETNYLLY